MISEQNPILLRRTWLRCLILALSDIKIAHSVFALPFAVLGWFIALPLAEGSGAAWPGNAADLEAATRAAVVPHLAGLGLVVVCMFFARTWAMLVNRLADWRFDAANPRTARRAVASGRLSARDGWLVALGCAAGFALACAGFWWLEGNPWPLFLCVPVLAWIAFYSFTKRFTMLAHLFLGGALAVSPIASAIAVQPRLVFGALGLMEPSTSASPGAGAALFFIAAFVLLWVAGFDVAYALQDLDFDRRTGLHSVPSKLGARGALWSARALHAGALAMLVLAARSDARFGGIMLSAAALAGAILVFEHVVLARRGVAGLPLAFFTLNGCVSLLMGAAGVADVLM